MRRAERWVAVVLVGGALAGCSGAKYEAPRDRNNTIDPGGQVFAPGEAWKEDPITIPAYPEAANLLPFEISGPTDDAHLIDSRSISIGKDGVVRYTVLVRTPTGVENVSYEGIRCEEREWKAYAYGRRDGTWALAREPGWRRVARQKADDFRYALYRDYFCPDGLPRRTAQEVVASIKRQYQAGPLDERK